MRNVYARKTYNVFRWKNNVKICILLKKNERIKCGKRNSLEGCGICLWQTELYILWSSVGFLYGVLRYVDTCGKYDCLIFFKKKLFMK